MFLPDKTTTAGARNNGDVGQIGKRANCVPTFESSVRILEMYMWYYPQYNANDELHCLSVSSTESNQMGNFLKCKHGLILALSKWSKRVNLRSHLYKYSTEIYAPEGNGINDVNCWLIALSNI